MNTKEIFIFATATLMTVTNIFAQENSNTFKLSEHHKERIDSSRGAISTSEAFGVKEIKLSAKNQTILSLYQSAYGLSEADFLVAPDVNYIQSTNQTYNVDFKGKPEMLILELDVSFGLKTEKVAIDSILLCINKIVEGTAIKPIKQFALSSKRESTVIDTDKKIKKVSGQLTAREIAKLVSETVNAPVTLNSEIENQVYEVNFSLYKKSSIDAQIEMCKSIGIVIEKTSKTHDYVQITALSQR